MKSKEFTVFFTEMFLNNSMGFFLFLNFDKHDKIKG